jgi:hypothetical protein
MTEVHAPQLTAEEASRIIAADIRAYPKDGPDKREEHLRLYSTLLSREAIEAAWAHRYAETAKPAPFRRRWPPPQQSSFLPAPQPVADAQPNNTSPPKGEVVPLISKGTMARLSAIADQGVEYNEADAEPEQLGQLVPFEPEPEDQAEPPVYTPKEIVRLNRQHAVIANLGGKCVIMEFVPSSVTPGATEPAYQTFTSFRERYLNQYVYDRLSGKRMSVGQFWLGHQRRRQYEGLDLVPHGPEVLPGNIFNLWRGWGVDPKEGDWSLLRKHVHEVLADADPKFAEYILHWTAWVLQNPAERPEAALTLRGGKGSGKRVWGDVLMIIFGEHGLQIFDPAHLTGKHNQHLQNKLFLFADEAFWAGDRTAERTLKGVVTEKRMMIEPKGVNAFPWPNRLSIYMAANADWVVPASHDERRYAVGNVNERWKQNEDYFIPLFAEIKGGGAAAMLYDLLKLDLGNWHPRKVPQTKALLEQKMLSLGGLEQWWVAMLNVGELPQPDKKNPRRVRSELLLEAAQNYSQRNKYLNETELGTFMGKMGCKHHSDGKRWGWIFPPLPEAREDWANAQAAIGNDSNPTLKIGA